MAAVLPNDQQGQACGRITATANTLRVSHDICDFFPIALEPFAKWRVEDAILINAGTWGGNVFDTTNRAFETGSGA